MKRALDVTGSVIGLLLLAPLLVLLALWIKLDSRGPVLFRQERVGRGGRLFKIHKLRTMVVSDALRQRQLTVGADPRITRAGIFLRRYKLDELPQLIDVLWGDMSLVGPRPEVPRYVAHYPEDQRAVVLSVRPGITDNASIEFADEARLLSLSSDPEKTYLEEVLPRKLALYTEYVRCHNTAQDLRIILRTIQHLFRHG